MLSALDIKCISLELYSEPRAPYANLACYRVKVIENSTLPEFFDIEIYVNRTLIIDEVKYFKETKSQFRFCLWLPYCTSNTVVVDVNGTRIYDSFVNVSISKPSLPLVYEMCYIGRLMKIVVDPGVVSTGKNFSQRTVAKCGNVELFFRDNMLILNNRMLETCMYTIQLYENAFDRNLNIEINSDIQEIFTGFQLMC